MYADWIHSWRDLPVKINQWCNVVRWEHRTRLFLRTTEFLWQEGHTFHQLDSEAAEEVDTMLDCYRELTEEWLAIPVIKGRKTESEKFPGARYTVSIEAMMADGWALQSGTSHHLGQNFTQAYGIAYSDRDNQRQHPFQTSWGLSARTVGAVIMAHGDDMGLILPPKVSPIQVIVVPITRSNDESGAAVVEEAVTRIERECPPGVRIRVDRREGMRPGEKYAHWELRGVPLRIIVGAKDLADGNVTVVHRVDGSQDVRPLAGLATSFPDLLATAQQLIFERARRRLAERSVDASTIDELQAAFAERPVFATAPFCNTPACEGVVKAAVHALTVRVLRADRPGGGAPCIACGEPAEFTALLARSY
jgi:prolyl-tRNA synthetase